MLVDVVAECRAGSPWPLSARVWFAACRHCRTFSYGNRLKVSHMPSQQFADPSNAPSTRELVRYPSIHHMPLSLTRPTSCTDFFIEKRSPRRPQLPSILTCQAYQVQGPRAQQYANEPTSTDTSQDNHEKSSAKARRWRLGGQTTCHMSSPPPSNSFTEQLIPGFGLPRRPNLGTSLILPCSSISSAATFALQPALTWSGVGGAAKNIIAWSSRLCRSA